MEEMVIFLDKLKEISFNSVTYSGISISPFELAEEELINKKKIISQAQRKIQEIDIFSGKNINKKDEIEIYQRKIAV